VCIILNIFESTCRTYIKCSTDSRLILGKKIKKYESAKNYSQSRIIVKRVRSRRVYQELSLLAIIRDWLWFLTLSYFFIFWLKWVKGRSKIWFKSNKPIQSYWVVYKIWITPIFIPWMQRWRKHYDRVFFYASYVCRWHCYFCDSHRPGGGLRQATTPAW
jgi:hypothetical protein